jgi:hypothetical protein
MSSLDWRAVLFGMLAIGAVVIILVILFGV